MFERFTEPARLVVVFAREEARAEVVHVIGQNAETVRNQVVAMLSGTGRRQASGIRRPFHARVPARAPVSGWALFAVALGLGILIGWAIWG